MAQLLKSIGSVQLVELYAEGVLPETETLTLLGNTVKGLVKRGCRRFPTKFPLTY